VALQERSLLQFDSFQQENKRLSDSNGQATHDLANMRFELGEQTKELERLQTHNADLDINHRSMLNATQNKEDMIRDLTQALAKLQEQHQSLTDSSNMLVNNFKTLSETKERLDISTIKLHGEVIVLKTQQESASQQEKVNLQRRGELVEQRVRKTIAGQIDELNQDVVDLQKINAYYKNELSKPQHMSMSAIARQEGFKIPLASSAINYRKNNLGTGQATLLRFGNKES
jgi:chromosome segregation ATPase